MAKKKKVKKEASTEKKRVSCIGFLRELYERDSNVSNEKALEKLLVKFPESNADTKSITTWKHMLREEGMDIPVLRAGRKATKKKGSKKKVSKKKNSKKK